MSNFPSGSSCTDANGELSLGKSCRWLLDSRLAESTKGAKSAMEVVLGSRGVKEGNRPMLFEKHPYGPEEDGGKRVFFPGPSAGYWGSAGLGGSYPSLGSRVRSKNLFKDSTNAINGDPQCLSPTFKIPNQSASINTP